MSARNTSRWIDVFATLVLLFRGDGAEPYNACSTRCAATYNDNVLTFEMHHGRTGRFSRWRGRRTVSAVAADRGFRTYRLIFFSGILMHDPQNQDRGVGAA